MSIRDGVIFLIGVWIYSCWSLIHAVDNIFYKDIKNKNKRNLKKNNNIIFRKLTFVDFKPFYGPKLKGVSRGGH